MKRGEQKTVNGLTAGVKIILGRNAFFRVGAERREESIRIRRREWFFTSGDVGRGGGE